MNFNEYVEKKLDDILIDKLSKIFVIIKGIFKDKIDDFNYYFEDFFDKIFWQISDLINLLNLDSEKIKAQCLNLLASKYHDYAQDNNRFSNFEKRSELLNLDINYIFLNDIANKIIRLENLLINNKTPKNETVEDSIIDLINYVLLFQAYKLGIK